VRTVGFDTSLYILSPIIGFVSDETIRVERRPDGGAVLRWSLGSAKMRGLLSLILLCSVGVSVCDAQQSPADSQNMTTEMQSMPGMDHDMQNMPGMDMGHTSMSWRPSRHEGSGTAWEPASAPLPMWMWSLGGWQFTMHGVIFIDYNQQGGPRGVGKAQSVNNVMFMEQHKLGPGTLLLKQMYSAESLTSPHPGFPELFQTGETYHGQPLVDHQHPHNVFAELSANYTVNLTEGLSWYVYGGPSAEPALGPVSHIHRTSASELPLTPLGHHLQDSTHISFGVSHDGLHFRSPQIRRFRVQWA